MDFALLAILVIFLVQLPAAGFSARVATAKGYDAVLWFMGGLFFGVLALIAAVGLPAAGQWVGTDTNTLRDQTDNNASIATRGAGLGRNTNVLSAGPDYDPKLHADPLPIWPMIIMVLVGLMLTAIAISRF